VFVELFRSAGEAVFIAAILGVTVDTYIKRHTYREISLDVFKFLIGYALPDEFKHRIRDMVTYSDLLRRDCSISWELHPVDGQQDSFKLDCKIIYKLQNISPRRVPYQFRTRRSAAEHQETRLTRLWGTFPDFGYEYPEERLAEAAVETDVAGGSWILGKKVLVDGENVRHGLEFEVGADYESTLRRQFDYHVFVKPTLGATVVVEHPKNFSLSLSPRTEGPAKVAPAGPGRETSTWKYSRLFFSDDAIFVEWTPKDDAPSAGGDASKLLKDKGQTAEEKD